MAPHTDRDRAGDPSARPLLDEGVAAPVTAAAGPDQRPIAGNPRLAAATRLLADESAAVRDAAWREIAGAGKPGLAALRGASRAAEPQLRARARAAVLGLERRTALRRLARYACRSALDLETGLLLLGHLDRPGLDARPYRRALDAMAAEVRRRAERERGAALALVLADHLGRELGFHGDVAGGVRPDDAYLHRAIERRRGLPLTLVAIHLLVARRAGVRAAAIALPGHVLLRVHAGARSVLLDPFRGGELRTRRECITHLRRHGFTPDARWFRAASDAELLQRQVLNLMHVHRQRGRPRRARELRRLALLLERSSTGPLEGSPRS